jgi:hypothetical protein
LQQRTYDKYGDEEGVKAKIWCIPVDGVFDWADRGDLRAVLGDVVPHFEN